MKKRILTGLLAFVLLLSLAGCSAAGMERTLETAEERAEERLDAVEDTVEQAVRRAVTPEPAATPTVPAAPTQPETVPSGAGSDPITKEGAEQIALDYAGLARDQVKRLHTEYEIDDGTGQYDVQFISGDWEYEFEIHAETGKILSYDKDHKYD